MKAFFVLLSLLVSSMAIAQSDIRSSEARILQNVKILNVQCQSNLVHRGHDWSYAGKVEVQLESGDSIEMAMLINRLIVDEQADAKALCLRMKQAKTANKRLDVIYTVGEDYEDYEGTNRMAIKGATDLRGLAVNP